MESRAAVTPGRWIRMGWDIVRADLGNFILISLVAVALTTVGSFVVAGPLIAGMFFVVRRRMLEGRAELMDLFAGFPSFVDAFLIYIIASVFAFVAMLLCFFPFLIVAALYLFPFLFMIDRKLPFWEAMESSRTLVAHSLAGYVIFVILLGLLNLLGVLMLGVGVLVTIPISIAAIAVAYNETVGYQYHPPETQGPVIIG
jgi:uncharacterized membrane protein